MTRLQIRTLLRRRVQEVTADQWQDSDLNEIINIAYQQMEAEILAVNSEAFVSTYQADILAANDGLVEKPPGYNHEISVKILSDGVYVPMDYISYSSALLRTSEMTFMWSDRGSHFYISPVPTQDLAAGIELDFVPTLSMTGDSDVPKIVQPLHMGIVYKGVIIAVGEKGESSKTATEELDRILGKIGRYYLRTASGQTFEPDLVGLIGA